MKRTAPKARVGLLKKRKASEKSRIPVHLEPLAKELTKELGAAAEDWEPKRTLQQNYKDTGVVLDPNQAFGRNTRPNPLPALPTEAGDAPQPDLLTEVTQKERNTAKALPPRPTERQRALLAALTKVHGDDFQAMVLDRGLNPMQHSAGMLRQLLQRCQYWSGNAGHDFRTPNKKYKRL